MSRASPPLEFGILGPLEVAIDGRPVEIRGAKQRTLLALLLVHRGKAVPVAAIIDELWPEAPPSTAQQSVQMHVSRLRRALVDAGDGDALLTSGAGYRIDVHADAIDANRFDRVLAQAERERSRRPAEARAGFDAALALWRGEALADVARGARLGAEAARLEERRLAAQVERAACLLELGDLSTATAELETLARLHPLQERVRMLLMEALARSGRKADALAVFRDARRTLVEEVGIEPSAALRDLHERLLQDEPRRTRVRRPIMAVAQAAPEPATAKRRPAPRTIGAVAIVVLALAAVIALVAGALTGSPRGLPSIDPEAVGVVDPRTGRIERQLAFGGRPQGAVAAAGAVWIANGSRGTVARIDRDNFGIVDTVAVGGDTTALTAADGAVWAVSSDQRAVARISPRTNAVVKRVRVGHGARAVVAASDWLWVANALDGTVTRIDPRAGRPRRTIPVGSGPAALAAGAGSVWVANEIDGSVTHIDAATGIIVATIGVGHGPSGIAFAGGSVWVGNAVDGTVSRIDPARDAEVAKREVGGTPRVLQASGDTVWIGSDTTDTIVALDPASGTVHRTLRVGNPVRSLVAVGDRLWVGVLAGPAAHRGGTLQIAGPNSAGASSLDPARAWSTETWPLLSVVADGLIAYRKVGGAAGATVVPDLAQALPVPDEGGKTYRFRLRPGLRYSDGRPVRAGDVRATIERLHRMHAASLAGYPLELRGEESCNTHRCDLSGGVEADDRSGTVVFHLRRPNPDFLAHLATPVYSILPAGTPLHPLGRDLIGTGPYRVSSVDPDRRLILERNPRFRAWSPSAQPPGFPDRIEWAIRSTDAERKSADVRYDPLPDRALRDLEVRAPDRVHPQLTPALHYLILNTRVPPFDSRLARRAVATAIDRARLSRIAFGDSAVPTCQALPPLIAGYEPYCPFGRARGAPGSAPDLPTARELVRRSGTQGAAVTVTAPSDAPDQVRAARALAHALESIGWRVRVSAERPAFGDSFPGPYAAAVARSRESLIGWANWFADLPTASKILLPLASCRGDRSLTPGSFNLSGSCDPALDRTMREAHTLATTDPAAAARLWAAADRSVVNSAAIIPVASSQERFVTSARVGNFQVNPAVYMLVSQMWVR